MISMNARTAVDREDLPGDPIGIFGCEEKGHGCYPLGMPQTKQMFFDHILRGT